MTAALARPALSGKPVPTFPGHAPSPSVVQSNEHASTPKKPIRLTKNSNASSAETFCPASALGCLVYLATKDERQTKPQRGYKGKYEVRWTIYASMPSGR